ncbi:Protein of unknown function [Modestobacter sp. DSM 44400]|uniref:DUF1622 domain-containing protein n=1 Tax=Modestobacter sp. DSM 44400 TaxID=1550230 RepID=UPI000895117E|nr:DUF1622 domain-containing protein [Modestobacter sp. DSM 44400]SDY46311.1 Protein of unknown function [Modestobacter sp. DSM 44400]
MTGPSWWSALLQGGALLLTVLGLGCGLLVLARRRDVRQALSVLLEFLLAAGLLRLSDDPTYRALATTAVIILIRKLVGFGLRANQRAGGPVGRARSTAGAVPVSEPPSGSAS